MEMNPTIYRKIVKHGNPKRRIKWKRKLILLSFYPNEPS